MVISSFGNHFMCLSVKSLEIFKTLLRKLQERTDTSFLLVWCGFAKAIEGDVSLDDKNTKKIKSSLQ